MVGLVVSVILFLVFFLVLCRLNYKKTPTRVKELINRTRTRKVSIFSSMYVSHLCIQLGTFQLVLASDVHRDTMIFHYSNNPVYGTVNI